MNELYVPSDVHPHRRKQPQFAQRPFTGGPRPEALIITCSECALDTVLSRHFERRPVFLLRTLGNEVSEFFHACDEMIEALDEAVSWWRVPHILVCGHSGCSALQNRAGGVQDGMADPAAPTSPFQSLLGRVGAANRNLEMAKRRTVDQLEALQSYPFVKNRLLEGELQLSALFYLHMSGLFLRYDEVQGEYRPLM